MACRGFCSPKHSRARCDVPAGGWSAGTLFENAVAEVQTGTCIIVVSVAVCTVDMSTATYACLAEDVTCETVRSARVLAEWLCPAFCLGTAGAGRVSCCNKNCSSSTCNNWPSNEGRPWSCTESWLALDSCVHAAPRLLLTGGACTTLMYTWPPAWLCPPQTWPLISWGQPCATRRLSTTRGGGASRAGAAPGGCPCSGYSCGHSAATAQRGHHGGCALGGMRSEGRCGCH